MTRRCSKRLGKLLFPRLAADQRRLHLINFTLAVIVSALGAGVMAILMVHTETF